MPSSGRQPKKGFFRKANGTLNKHNVAFGILISFLTLIATAIGVWVNYWSASSSANTPPPIPQPNSGISINQTASGDGNTQSVSPVNVYGRDSNDTALISDLSKKLGVTEQLIRSFLLQMNKEDIPRENWDKALAVIVEEYKKFQQEASAFVTDDPETKRLIDEAIRLAEEARFEEAQKKLDEAQRKESEASKLLKEKWVTRTLKSANILSLKAKLYYTQGHYLEAATHYKNAASTLSEIDSHLAIKYLANAALAYQRQGRFRGDNPYLDSSISMFKNLSTHTDPKTYPIFWASLQNNLGLALHELGRKENDSKKLLEAINAHKNALTIYSRNIFPFKWAMAQNNLGNALWELGRRDKDA